MNLQLTDIDLKNIKKQYLLERLDNLYKTGVIKSETEYSYLVKNIESISLDTPSMILRKQIDLTDAENINQSFQELNIDLNVLFKQVDLLDQSINRQQRLNQSSVENSIIELKILDEELDNSANLINNSGQTFYKESFIDGFNVDLDPALRLDRDGSLLPFAYMDMEHECVKLPLINEVNCLVNVLGQSIASINVIRQVAASFREIENPKSSLDKAIDTSPDTYWYCSILTDEPVKVNFGPEAYGIKEGVPFILDITLNAAQSVNQLSFKPFTRFPIDIISVMAFSSDNPNEQPISLVSPFQAIEDLRNVSTKDLHVYTFPDIVVKKFWIILNQRHYIERDIILSSRDKIKERNLLTPVSIIPSPATLNFANYETICEEMPGIMAFLKATSEIQNDIDKILKADTEDTRVPVVKYQYEFGMFDIGVKYNQFAMSAVYVSSPISLGGVIREVSIAVSEKIPIYLNDQLKRFKLANIEYYIGDPDNEFYPIVPLNIDTIYNELLIMKTYLIRGQQVFGAKTVAKYDRIITVKGNGLPLGQNEYMINNDIIIINDWKFGTIYTVDYVPTEEAKIVKFDLNNETITQVFNGTDNAGKIHLSKYHFIDKEILYKLPEDWNPSILSGELIPVVVTIKLATGETITQPLNSETAVRLENKTDYFTGNIELEQFAGQNYQYCIYGNEMQFNTVLAKDITVTVNYSYLIDTLRVKAILRRIVPDQFGVTPIMQDYMLLTKIIK